MSQTVTTSIDDTSSNITYAGNWLKDTNFPSIYGLYDNSDSYSEDHGASATLRFYGTSIEYWGNQDANRGPCSLTLDGNDAGSVTSYATVNTPPVILYSNYNLPLGDHTLVITVASQQTGLRCEIDRFVVGIEPTITPTSVVPSTNTPAPVPPIETTTPGSPLGTTMPSPSTITPSTSASAVAVSLVPELSITVSSTISMSSSSPMGANVSDISANSSHSIPVSVFIGSVLGAIAVACLLIFLFRLYRQHKRATSFRSQDGLERNIENGSGISTSRYSTSFMSDTPLSYAEADSRIRRKEPYNGNIPSTSAVLTTTNLPPPPPAYHF